MVYWTTAAIQVGFTVISRKQEILNTMTTNLQNRGGRGDAGNTRRMRVGRAAASGGGGAPNCVNAPVARSMPP